MHSEVLILLLCVCAAHAHHYHRDILHLPSRPMPLPSRPMPLPSAQLGSYDLFPEPNSRSPYKSYDHFSPPTEPETVYPSRPFDPVQPDSWEEVDDHFGENPCHVVSLDPEPEASKTWIAPPYKESLLDIEDALGTLRSHFTPDAFEDKKSKEYHYSVLIGVINYLSKDFAASGLEYYIRNYKKLVDRYIRVVTADPRNTIRMMECGILQPTERAIKEVKEVIENPSVQYVCKVQPSACNAAIWAIIHSESPVVPFVKYDNNNNKNERAPEMLLAAGEAASIFLQSFAALFETVSENNVFKYLQNAKEELIPLISASAHARNVVDPSGDTNCLMKNNFKSPERHITTLSIDEAKPY